MCLSISVPVIFKPSRPKADKTARCLCLCSFVRDPGPRTLKLNSRISGLRPFIKQRARAADLAPTCYSEFLPYSRAMLPPWTSLLRLFGTLLLALAVAWIPAVSAAQTLESAAAASVTVFGDMDDMDMSDMDEYPCDLCVVDMTSDANCPVVGSVALPASAAHMMWSCHSSVAVFAWRSDPSPREQNARPPLQPPKTHVFA